MPLRRLRYATLHALLRGELVREEDPATAALIRELAGVCPRGSFTRAEFRRMCRWKSPRARRLWEANSAARVRGVSRAMLATDNERRRMELLTSLRGVGVPIASAILTLIDPRRYGVLDIRAWQLLFATRSVTTNPRGQSFTITQWQEYLAALRHHARRLRVTARTIEYTLFECHRKHQRHALYERRKGAAPLRDSRTARNPRGDARGPARP